MVAEMRHHTPRHRLRRDQRRRPRPGPGRSTAGRSAGGSTTTAPTTPASRRPTATARSAGSASAGRPAPGASLVLVRSEDLDASRRPPCEAAGGERRRGALRLPRRPAVHLRATRRQPAGRLPALRRLDPMAESGGQTSGEAAATRARRAARPSGSRAARRACASCAV